MNKKKIIGIILGDHAGIGPETVAKTLLSGDREYIPVLIGNRKLFEKTLNLIYDGKTHKIENCCSDWNHESFKDDRVIYFYDISVGPDVAFGKTSADSGLLMYESLAAAVQLEKSGIVDGLVMAPITKNALHLAGKNFKSEFEIFEYFYGVKNVKAVIKCGDIYRCTVVGHCSFSSIISNLTKERIESTGRDLFHVMRLFRPADDCKIAVAALNPHAGEDGLFGDEEAKIITPAINTLKSEGEDVIGPCPADTVLLKARHGEVHGIVYLYHDQGNIAMKSGYFGEAVLIYTKIPAHIVSVSHGSAMDIAGRGEADEKNLNVSIDVLLQILDHGKKY